VACVLNGSILALIELLGEPRSRDIDFLPELAGARHLDTIVADAVRHVVGVQRV
jgi:hypothetical protein